MSGLPPVPVRRGELPSAPQTLEPMWVRGVLIATRADGSPATARRIAWASTARLKPAA